MANNNQTSKKSRPSFRNDSWHWVRSLADSMIVMAAALTVIGVDLKPYFEAKARISILKMEAELKEKNPPNNAILVLNQRLTELEKHSHKPGEK